jgi:hypothetical protein
MSAVEAVGMVPQIERIADPHGIAVQGAGGFNSLTCKHELPLKLRTSKSSTSVITTRPARTFSTPWLKMFGPLHAIWGKRNLPFSRPVVTRQQIDDSRCPPRHPGETDRRGFDDTETVQAGSDPAG